MVHYAIFFNYPRQLSDLLANSAKFVTDSAGTGVLSLGAFTTERFHLELFEHWRLLASCMVVAFELCFVAVMVVVRGAQVISPAVPTSDHLSLVDVAGKGSNCSRVCGGIAAASHHRRRNQG